MLRKVPIREIRSEGYSFLIELLAALRDSGHRRRGAYHLRRPAARLVEDLALDHPRGAVAHDARGGRAADRVAPPCRPGGGGQGVGRRAESGASSARGSRGRFEFGLPETLAFVALAIMIAPTLAGGCGCRGSSASCSPARSWGRTCSGSCPRARSTGWARWPAVPDVPGGARSGHGRVPQEPQRRDPARPAGLRVSHHPWLHGGLQRLQLHRRWRRCSWARYSRRTRS